MNKLYISSENGSSRFVLGEKREKNLVIVGVNPSTATNIKDDNTIKRVRNLSIQNGFDGFIMINLYPLRATCPDDLPMDLNCKLHDTNLEQIKKLFEQLEDFEICFAYGNIISKRKYLEKCKMDIENIIAEYDKKILCFGMTKDNNPKHPLYLKSGTKLIEFI